MATVTPKLTWDKAARRWKKIYRGRIWYGQRGVNKSDRNAYGKALENFLRWRSDIDQRKKPHREQYETALHLRQEMLDWLLLEGETDTDEHRRLLTEIGRLNSDWQRPKPPALDTLGQLSVNPLYPHPPLSPDWQDRGRDRHHASAALLSKLDVERAIIWPERLASLRNHQKWTDTAEHTNTIGGLIDEFLNSKKIEAEYEVITPATWETMRHRLNHLRTHLGATAVEQFNRKTLPGFLAHLHTQIKEGNISNSYARGILTSTKAFIKWLWREEIIEDLPRNLDTLKISVERRAIETFSVEEVKLILTEATEIQQLYYLLMLNCGMTQKDISDLHPSEVDWETGRIRRKRSKTKNVENVPEVDYKLWGDTFTLLKKYGKRDGDHALLNARGLPLSRRGFKDGKVQCVDNIKKGYERLCTRLKIPMRKLKLFRKTGATFVAGKFDTHLASYYLGHSGGNVANNHYIAHQNERLQEATEKLHKQFVAKEDTADETTAWLKSMGVGDDELADIDPNDPNLDLDAILGETE